MQKIPVEVETNENRLFQPFFLCDGAPNFCLLLPAVGQARYHRDEHLKAIKPVAYGIFREQIDAGFIVEIL